MAYTPTNEAADTLIASLSNEWAAARVSTDKMFNTARNASDAGAKLLYYVAHEIVIRDTASRRRILDALEYRKEQLSVEPDESPPTQN